MTGNETQKLIERIYSIFDGTKKHDIGAGILLGALLVDRQFGDSESGMRYLTHAQDLDGRVEQCAVCSATIIRWDFTFVSDKQPHFFCACACSLGDSTVSRATAETSRRQKSRARLMEAASDDPELSRVRRQMEEEHQRNINKKECAHLDTVSDLKHKLDDAKRHVNQLQQEVGRLSGEVEYRGALIKDRDARIGSLEYTLDELAEREDEQDDTYSDKTEVPEIVIPLRIQVRS